MNYSNHLKKRVLAAIAAGSLLFASGCAGNPEVVTATAQESPTAIPVETTTVSRGSLSRGTEFVGRIESGESVKIFPSSQGQIVHTYFNAGDRVQEGDLLFELDTEDLETSLELAYLQYQTALISADTSLMNAERTKENSARAYVTAKDNWDDLEEDYDDQRSALREDRDLKQKVMEEAQKAYKDALEAAGENKDDPNLKKAEEDLAAAESAYKTAVTAFTTFVNTYEKTEETYKTNKTNAKTDLEYAERAYDLVNGDEENGIMGSAQSAIRQAELSYERAQKALEEAKVYAPISGVITAKNADDSDMVAMTSPVYVISGEDKAPVVTFNLSEDGANAIAIGDSVTIVYNNQEYEAKVTELAAEADPSTGLYAAKAQPSVALDSVRTGAVVKVKASTANADDAMILPLELVEYDENQPYVYVYRDGTAVRVDIVTSMSTADSIVVESGLTEEDQIITTWHPDLKDGAAVYNKALEEASQPQESQEEESQEQESLSSNSSDTSDGKGE